MDSLGFEKTRERGRKKGLVKDLTLVKQGEKGQRNRNVRRAGKTFPECNSLSCGEKKPFSWQRVGNVRPRGSLKAGLGKPLHLCSHVLSGTRICVCKKSLCVGICHFLRHPKMPEPLGSCFAGRWCQKGRWPRWVSPQRGCAEVLWPEEGAHRSSVLPCQQGRPAQPPESSWSGEKGKRLRVPKWH